MSKKVNEEQVAETEYVIGGYIRWNVYFTRGVSTPVKEEPAIDESAEEERLKEKHEPELSPPVSPQPKEKKTICSFFGFSCQKE